jgi:hypothetical protein
MNQSNAGRLLWKLAVAAAGAAVLAIVLAAALPLDLPVEDAAPTAAAPIIADTPRKDAVPTLEQWANVWSIDLGHDVTATAPPPDVQTAPAPNPPPDLHFIGTVIEPAHSAAMLIGPAGKTVFLRVGDQEQSATIIAIAADSVTVQIDGKPVIFRLEKPPPPPSPKPAVITTPEDQ